MTVDPAYGEDALRTIPERMAIVFGSETVGCSDTMLKQADKRVYLPLHGFADSLNLSVSTVSLFGGVGCAECWRQCGQDCWRHCVAARRLAALLCLDAHSCIAAAAAADDDVLNFAAVFTFFFGLIFFVFTTRLYMVSSRLLFLTSGVGFAAIVYYGAGCCRRHVCDDKHTVFFFRFFSVCRHAEHAHTQALTDAHTRTCTDARILHVYLCLCARLRAFQMSSYPRSHKMLQKHLLCGHVQVQVYGLFDIFDDL